ncbi:hypothetical protein [Paraburkholderia hiiakae]|uniref:hypothetical protein n=1 Tax=Paraburkholderia hiiakae TaxID=1081782 RepID=UPI001919ACF6|nr:hypothetical protein [Paraburkholderia hiiakae]
MLKLRDKTTAAGVVFEGEAQASRLPTDIPAGTTNNLRLKDGNGRSAVDAYTRYACRTAD